MSKSTKCSTDSCIKELNNTTTTYFTGPTAEERLEQCYVFYKQELTSRYGGIQGFA